jgi:hypothetical protein
MRNYTKSNPEKPLNPQKAMKKILLLSFLFLLACTSQTAHDESPCENWSLFRGNPALSGYTHVSLSDNPVLLWAFTSNAFTRSSPVIYNQVVYWSSRRGCIFGVNIEGQQVFRLCDGNGG